MQGISDNRLPDDWRPPSKEIQSLFQFSAVSEQKSNVDSSEHAHAHSFSDDEFSKMPSTLAKAIRRTDDLLILTETLRKTAIDANNEVKTIHNLMVRHARKHLKESEKRREESDSEPKGFKRPCPISDVMREFLGKEPDSAVSRVEVNNAINEYIKRNGLVDPENARRILPDDRLWSLLSESARGGNITYFNLQKYIKHHFLKRR